MEWVLNCIIGRGWKNCKAFDRKGLDCFDKTVCRIYMLKVLPMRTLKKIMNVLLGTGGKVILVLKWHRTWKIEF